MSGHTDKSSTATGDPLTDAPSTQVANVRVSENGGIWVFTWGELIHSGMNFLALVVALVFGVWAVKSWYLARNANDLSTRSIELSTRSIEQTVLANKLALLSFCSLNQVGFARFLLHNSG
jgi:hypothetical protein